MFLVKYYYKKDNWTGFNSTQVIETEEELLNFIKDTHRINIEIFKTEKIDLKNVIKKIKKKKTKLENKLNDLSFVKEKLEKSILEKKGE